LRNSPLLQAIRAVEAGEEARIGLQRHGLRFARLQLDALETLGRVTPRARRPM
jgi:hypothetical protein